MGNQAGEETMVMERFDDEIEAQINQDLRLKHRRILLQVCKNKIFLLVKAIVELKTNPALKLTHRKILLPDSKSQIFLLVKHQNNIQKKLVWPELDRILNQQYPDVMG